MAVTREYDPYAPQPGTTNPAPSLYQTDINAQLQSSNNILQGATSRTSNVGGRTATVRPGENITAALETLKSAGGGILFLQAGTYQLTENLVGTSKISIVGEGRDQTIILFQNTTSTVRYIGTAADVIDNFTIENVTIQGGAGVRIDCADNWEMRNVYITNSADDGVLIKRSRNFLIDTCEASNSGDSGFNFQYTASGDDRDMYGFNVINSRAQSNNIAGFIFYNGATSTIYNFTVSNCYVNANGDYGFYFETASSTRYDGVISGCFANNSYIGFHTVLGLGLTVIGCTTSGNERNGIFYGADNTIIGCRFLDTVVGSTPAESSGGHRAIFVGNEVYFDAATSPNNSLYLIGSERGGSIGLNRGVNDSIQRRYAHIKNVSGAQRSSGEVVIYAASDPKQACTTTTTLGDDYVVGMVTETIADNAYGAILKEGFTNQLKVNGTTDIAIGDFLTTFTTAGIACKATAGDMAFAIALEAYTTDNSSGVIDALLIPPRKL